MKKDVKEEVLPATKTVSELASLGQEGIPALLKHVDSQIASLGGGKQAVKTTEGVNLPGFGSINSQKKVSSLVQMYSSVTARENAYGDALKATGVDAKKYPFKLEGHTAEAWKNDIKVAIDILSNAVELAKLVKVKATLEANLSQKAKLQNDLAKIGAWLTDEGPLE